MLIGREKKEWKILQRIELLNGSQYSYILRFFTSLLLLARFCFFFAQKGFRWLHLIDDTAFIAFPFQSHKNKTKIPPKARWNLNIFWQKARKSNSIPCNDADLLLKTHSLIKSHHYSKKEWKEKRRKTTTRKKQFDSSNETRVSFHSFFPSQSNELKFLCIFSFV